MLDKHKIVEIARNVAVANLTSGAVVDVQSKPFTDSEGVESLRITIVLKDDFLDRIRGEDTLNTLVGINAGLQKAGEERFPLVEYATEEELQESGDA